MPCGKCGLPNQKLGCVLIWFGRPDFNVAHLSRCEGKCENTWFLKISVKKREYNICIINCMYIGIGIGFTYVLYHNVLTNHDMTSVWLSKPAEFMVIYILYTLNFFTAGRSKV